MSTLYDPIRMKFVADLPEERVRQALLHQMMQTLGYPKGLIAVEKNVGRKMRRADIIVFIKKKTALKPLLLIECKADAVDEETYWQAAGYNEYLAAPFVCLAHRMGIRTFWKEAGGVQSVRFLPPYAQLISRVDCE